MIRYGMPDVDIMQLGVDKARTTMNNQYGGPFGAVIVKDDDIIAVSSNTVLHDNDPTAHAEINAIRMACKQLGTHDLSGCELYATSYPCPMCMSAIIWANISKVYYGCSASDTSEIGFRDDFIYEYIKYGSNDVTNIEFIQLDKHNCIELLKEYSSNSGEIY